MAEERRRVTYGEIITSRFEAMTPEQKRAALPRDFVDYKPKLYRNLVLPSYVHGYSLAIEYMKYWFLEKFDKDYFKVVHINGKHVLDDWKRFNNYNIKREKPMLAIVPTLENDFDRENLDLYQADHTILLRTSNFMQSFFKDYDRMSFIYMKMRAMRMNFAFKVRVNSRSEQLDVMNKMELWFRVGSTMREYLNADFHIPYDIMTNVAKAAHFDVDKDGNIVDILEFIAYLNKYSDLPIIFKMRAINQKPEFFVRANNMYVHISNIDKLQIDDGDREGKLDTNFHVEMNCTLEMPIPHFFVYFCQEPLVYKIGVNEHNGKTIGVYSINNFEIPPQNEKNWTQVAVTSYCCDEGEQVIDLSPIFKGDGNFNKAVEYSLHNMISPESFVDIRVYRSEDVAKRMDCEMNYDNFQLLLPFPMRQDETIDIAIYADKQYVNEVIISTENLKHNRIGREKEKDDVLDDEERKLHEIYD